VGACAAGEIEIRSKALKTRMTGTLIILPRPLSGVLLGSVIDEHMEVSFTFTCAWQSTSWSSHRGRSSFIAPRNAARPRRDSTEIRPDSETCEAGLRGKKICYVCNFKV
jgi:hypothetical protein